MKLPVFLSVLSAVTAWQHVDLGLRILASIVAICAGAPAAWRFLSGAWRRLRATMAK
jgi:hypothetical protein